MKKMLLLVFLLSLSSCSEEKSRFATFVVNYDYNMNSSITILFNSSYFTFDLGKFTIPDNLIPGDSITIEYTGELYTLTSYPGQIVLNGELLDLEINYTTTIKIEDEKIIKNELGTIETLNSYSNYDEFVILDSDLNYIELSKYEGNILYGSIDIFRKDQNINNDSPIGALFAFDPRGI